MRENQKPIIRWIDTHDQSERFNPNFELFFPAAELRLESKSKF